MKGISICYILELYHKKFIAARGFATLFPIFWLHFTWGQPQRKKTGAPQNNDLLRSRFVILSVEPEPGHVILEGPVVLHGTFVLVFPDEHASASYSPKTMDTPLFTVQLPEVPQRDPLDTMLE